MGWVYCERALQLHPSWKGLSGKAKVKTGIRAAKSGDRKTMIESLTTLQLVESDAAWTADTILANPAKYGF